MDALQKLNRAKRSIQQALESVQRAKREATDDARGSFVMLKMR